MSNAKILNVIFILIILVINSAIFYVISLYNAKVMEIYIIAAGFCLVILFYALNKKYFPVVEFCIVFAGFCLQFIALPLAQQNSDIYKQLLFGLVLAGIMAAIAKLFVPRLRPLPDHIELL